MSNDWFKFRIGAILVEMQWIATSQMQHPGVNISKWVGALCIFSAAFCWGPKVLAQQEVTLPASSNLEEVYQACVLCHGTKEMQRGPILDGLPAWYIERQLGKFAAGKRGQKEENRSSLLMIPVVQQYDDPQLWSKLAKRFESLPKPDHIKTIRGNPERGKQLYAVCASCHGPQGQGNLTINAPPLNVQEDWYLMDQLRKFKMDWRGYDPDDVEGNLMRNITKIYSINDLKDIVAYIVRMEEKNAAPTFQNFKEGEVGESER